MKVAESVSKIFLGNAFELKLSFSFVFFFSSSTFAVLLSFDGLVAQEDSLRGLEQFYGCSSTVE
jgi:hypothetical protein